MDGAMDWATVPRKKYAELSGRARRKEYWMYTLLVIVGSIVIGIVEGILGLAGMFGGYGLLRSLFMLAILVPSIAVGVRRLHDTNRSGWWMLLALVPIIGSI